MVVLLECFVAQIAEMGVKGALECVHPAAGKAVDLFRGVWQKWQARRQLDQMRRDVEELAKLSAEQIAADVSAKLNELIPVPLEEARDLELYVSLIPAAIRQSLKRPDDPAGLSAPITLALHTPIDLVRLFPANLPLHRPGDSLPGLSSWTLTRVLGAGGFGEVWLATHAVDSTRRSAVKFCTDKSSRLPLIEHELKQVVRLMRAGGHANVVPLLEYNLGGECPWLMYEYVSGGTLTDAVMRWQRLPTADRVERAVAAVVELCAAVGHLHRLDPPLVHRDLKPANVLVCEQTGRLRVTDLGLGGSAVEYALSAESNGGHTITGRLPSLLFGSHSLNYASPEQRRGGPPDPRDDVHALGVIAYQLLTGKLDAAPGSDTADDLREAETPGELIALVGRCVSQRADRRPANANEIAERLGRTAPAPTVPKPPEHVISLTPVVPDPSPTNGRLPIPVRGRWWAIRPADPKPAWKTVGDTPAEVVLQDGEEYRLELPARVTDGELTNLTRLAREPGAERIVRIDLSGCEQVTDVGLAHMARLQGVRHLNLYGCIGLTDQGMRHLTQLERLTRLDLTRCRQLTDQALVPLGGITALEHLSLGGCEWITDAGLVHLTRLKSLKVLSVRGTQVTDARAERFTRGVPGCRVEM
jgi:eukaryotic-like serine/threonine-protein kinase